MLPSLYYKYIPNQRFNTNWITEDYLDININMVRLSKETWTCKCGMCVCSWLFENLCKNTQTLFFAIHHIPLTISSFHYSQVGKLLDVTVAVIYDTVKREPADCWGRDKMAAVSLTTLSNAFSWIKLS